MVIVVAIVIVVLLTLANISNEFWTSWNKRCCFCSNLAELVFLIRIHIKSRDRRSANRANTRDAAEAQSVPTLRGLRLPTARGGTTNSGAARICYECLLKTINDVDWLPTKQWLFLRVSKLIGNIKTNTSATITITTTITITIATSRSNYNYYY